MSLEINCKHATKAQLHITQLFWEHGIEDGIVGVESTEDGDTWIGIVIGKEDAEKIVKHLISQFSLNI